MRERVCAVQGPLREREGEVETLPEPSEGEEGLGGEAAGGHQAVRLLVGPRRALAAEPPHQQVHTRPPVSADPRGAAARPR